jgi:hypothetical protein
MWGFLLPLHRLGKRFLSAGARIDRCDELPMNFEGLRSELEAERSKGFWARLFGG